MGRTRHQKSTCLDRIVTQVDDPAGPVVSAYADLIEQLAAAITGRGRRGQTGAVLAISGAPFPALNGIVSPSLEPNPDEIAALAESEDWDVPWGIKVRGVPSPLVMEVAARYGLTEVTRDPLMIRRPDQGWPPKPATGSLRIRAVTPDEMGEYTAVLADGFELPHEAFRFLAVPSAAKIAGVTFYLAEADGVPVGTAMAAISAGLTGLYNIATLPRYRRRGYGRAITTEMLRAGFAAGAPTAYLFSSSMGEPVYESAGFRTEEYLSTITAPSVDAGDAGGNVGGTLDVCR